MPGTKSGPCRHFERAPPHAGDRTTLVTLGQWYEFRRMCAPRLPGRRPFTFHHGHITPDYIKEILLQSGDLFRRACRQSARPSRREASSIGQELEPGCSRCYHAGHGHGGRARALQTLNRSTIRGTKHQSTVPSACSLTRGRLSRHATINPIKAKLDQAAEPTP